MRRRWVSIQPSSWSRCSAFDGLAGGGAPGGQLVLRERERYQHAARGRFAVAVAQLHKPPRHPSHYVLGGELQTVLVRQPQATSEGSHQLHCRGGMSLHEPFDGGPRYNQRAHRIDRLRRRGRRLAVDCSHLADQLAGAGEAEDCPAARGGRT